MFTGFIYFKPVKTACGGDNSKEYYGTQSCTSSDGEEKFVNWTFTPPKHNRDPLFVMKFIHFNQLPNKTNGSFLFKFSLHEG